VGCKQDFQSPLALKPSDPFVSLESFLRIQSNRTLKWLSENEPPAERVILASLHKKCKELLKEIAEYPGGASSQKSINKADEILRWIKRGHGDPLTDEEREHYAMLLDLCGVPLLNAHMALAKTTRSRRGAGIQIARDTVILAAEQKLADPDRPWSKIARSVGASNPGSLRKAVDHLRKFCRAQAIVIPNPRRNKSE
jgi:hypothetical protein